MEKELFEYVAERAEILSKADSSKQEAKLKGEKPAQASVRPLRSRLL